VGPLVVYVWLGLFAALELVVDKRITGLPVVDEDNKVVGVVSDFDLLAIDLPTDEQRTVFPSLEQSWEVMPLQSINALRERPGVQ